MIREMIPDSLKSAAADISQLQFNSRLFAETFFAHYCRLPFSMFHLDSFAWYDSLARQSVENIESRHGRRLGIAAPRGAAKSAIHSLILPLMDLSFRRERFILMISATMAQAAQRLANLKAELQLNRSLTDAFPHLARRLQWNRFEAGIGDALIKAAGAGTELRGLAHGAFRPTKIILDDAEWSSRTMTRDGRQQMLDWFNEVIENLGDTYTHIEMLGTVLHPESLLALLESRPKFEYRIYRSIRNWAQNDELWQQWRKLLNMVADPQRESTALGFFRENETQMLEGSSILWPEKENYYSLMLLREAIGWPAFEKEKQNNPRLDRSRIFYSENWSYFRLLPNGRIEIEPAEATEPVVGAIHISELLTYGFLDSAACSSEGLRKSDFASIVTVGRDGKGLLYVLDCWLDRVPPSEQVEKVFDLYERWGWTRFGFETNGTMGTMRDLLTAEAKRRKPVGRSAQLDMIGIRQSDSKEKRFLTAETLFAKRAVLVSRSLPHELYEQADDFPRGRHDDALDAMISALTLATRHSGRSRTRRHAESTRTSPPSF
jgi:predicted phage terminase large subunit-like protein